jgi:choline dehydrogenase-like flavoprotein
MLVEFKDVSGNLRDEVDFVVVGAGCAGPVVARELQDDGFSVALVEEGPWFRLEQLVREPGRAMQLLYREAGLRTTMGNVFMPTMQAKCVGGTGFVNSAICFRTPEIVLKDWRRNWGIEIDDARLAESFDRVEKFASIKPTEFEIQGKRNLLVKKGLEKLGFHSAPNNRNVDGCEGCCDCFTGCPCGGKKSTENSYIPALLEKGGKVYVSCRVEQVTTDGARATGIKGTFVEPGTDRPSYSLSIKARKAVVLAAGVLATPVLLLKNGLANANGRVGRNLCFHPGVGMPGIFDEDVFPWWGAYQGWHSLELARDGFKLETFWGPPAVFAVRIPYFGIPHKEILAKFKNMSTIDMIYRTRHSIGRVRAGKGWDPVLTYHVDQRDIDAMRPGMKACSDVLFAAGAKQVLPGVFGLPPIFDDPAMGELLLTTRIKPTDLTLVANHVFGTCAMGGDRARTVVGNDGETHDVRDLYVADTSILPTGTIINPMETIMGLADYLAQKMKARYH